MRKIAPLLFFIFGCGGISAAHDTLFVEGAYQGKNLYVQNPFDNSGKGFCTKKVLVNNTIVPFDSASAFEINLGVLNLAIGDKVKIAILHSPDCSPKILNPTMNCHPVCMYSIIAVKIENDSMLTWTSAEQNGKFIYIVEQFRWNKWVKCGDVVSTNGFDTATYSFAIKKHLHSGMNQFRVKVIDYSSKPVQSAIVKHTEPEIKSFMLSRCGGEISFVKETYWEMYDKDRNLIRKGYGNVVKLDGLKKGAYFLNYDNTTAEFFKN
jgi:hypothetical protein